ncbi:PE family protein, partial [Mycobacterium riyadhense]
MSYVYAVPEMINAATADLAGIGSAVSAANAAAAFSTTAVVAAGSDEVSAAIAAVFGSHAQEYQALSAQLGRFHDQFVRNLRVGVSAYGAAEATNAAAAAEQQLLDLVNAPSLALTGRILIGDGANGTSPGQAGGNGGWLWGNGGNGAPGAAGQAGGRGGDAGLL